ncbi:diacylglycerol kinase (ATP) [Amphritea atlantica]|uniref:Diacylglycerol kinase n=1 Tax=Amphritea atlantica TaxID=355243 RepID=A0A1H9GHY8_9GAMM|nr:diacylglycerol kinase [Amphritea atlantica]SEQ49712.1 diacylglycerol kinase (ATP) [Amphritea atlantica]
MHQIKRTGVKRFYFATKYSMQGIKAAWQEEPAFRYEVCAVVVMLPAAFWLAQSGIQLALLLACCFLVLAFEIVNSAIEAVVDRWGPEYHELAGRAKDMGSAAVFMMLNMTWVVWAGVAWDNGYLDFVKALF